jgi:hypothetical protein
MIDDSIAHYKPRQKSECDTEEIWGIGRRYKIICCQETEKKSKEELEDIH